MLDSAIPEGLRVALETRLKRQRLAELLFDMLDGRCRFADRRARSRLNEIVTDGNWPWWLTTSGATLTTLATSVDRGTSWPVERF